MWTNKDEAASIDHLLQLEKVKAEFPPELKEADKLSYSPVLLL